MFDVNSDTYSQFFMNYSGLIISNDSTGVGKFLGGGKICSQH
ncbi:hypothetical protein [Methanobrevibacter thaueri]|nr:hypothetical protein [Methanobrevibacter thaueri]